MSVQNFVCKSNIFTETLKPCIMELDFNNSEERQLLVDRWDICV